MKLSLAINSLPRTLALAAAYLLACLLTGFGEDPISQDPATLRIVAAENFYGGVAQEIAGPSAKVISILSNPNQDPHQFTTDAATARAVADADIVIYNGLGYDSWMEKLLGVQGKPGRIIIRVADLTGAKPGDNPHIWYDPRTMPALAARLSEILKQPDKLAAFQKEMGKIFSKISEIKSAHNGTPVTATEPVFGCMAAVLGLKMENDGFQLAVMNDTEPGFQQTAHFEKSLHQKAVKALFYNSQVTNPVTERMQKIARESGVSVIGVSETQPPGANSYVDWMLAELNKVESAMGASQ